MAECRDSLANNTNAPKQSVVLGHRDSSEENKTDKVMEPMLIEDFKNDSVPTSFQIVHRIRLERGTVLDKNDELITLLHILMLESGFVTSSAENLENSPSATFHNGKFLSAVANIPSTWKRSNLHYHLTYVLPPYVDHPCNLVCSANADDVLVNCIVANIDGANYCMMIDPSLYIMSSTTQLCNKYQNMSHLSRTFKTNISDYAKVTILRHNDTKAACLEDMPPEIMMNVLQYFTPRTLAVFEETCTYFRKVSNDPTVWKNIIGAKYDTFGQFKKAEVNRLQLRDRLNSLWNWGRDMRAPL